MRCPQNTIYIPNIICVLRCERVRLLLIILRQHLPNVQCAEKCAKNRIIAETVQIFTNSGTMEMCRHLLTLKQKRKKKSARCSCPADPQQILNNIGLNVCVCVYGSIVPVFSSNPILAFFFFYPNSESVYCLL